MSAHIIIAVVILQRALGAASVDPHEPIEGLAVGRSSQLARVYSEAAMQDDMMTLLLLGGCYGLLTQVRGRRLQANAFTVRVFDCPLVLSHAN